jgi:pilus assembly protein CpaB
MAERRYTLVFTAAIATAVAATFGVYRVLQTTKEQSRVRTSQIVVAAKDLPEGTNLEKMMLTVKEWPTAAVPSGAVTVVDSLVGRVTRVPVFTGEAFVAGRLAPVGSGAGLEVKIAPGKRAMAIRINDVAGIAGLIQPNSRVDVLVTMRESGSQDRQVAKLFMENMRVLSVGTQFERGEDGKPMPATTATLEVTPQESERLAVASNAGSIQLVLRGYGDPDTASTRGAASSDVVAQLGAARPAPAVQRAAAPQPRRPTPAPQTRPQPAPAAPVVVTPVPAPRPADSVTVTVFRGEKASQQKFSKPDSVRTP